MRALLLALALAGCRKLPQDPGFTGIAIWPDAGRHDGPIDLIVKSRTADPVACTAVVSDVCPAPAGFIEALAVLDPRERVRLDDAPCLTVDVACTVVGAPATEAPIRTWSWEVLAPLTDAEGPIDEEDVAFDGLADTALGGTG